MFTLFYCNRPAPGGCLVLGDGRIRGTWTQKRQEKEKKRKRKSIGTRPLAGGRRMAPPVPRGRSALRRQGSYTIRSYFSTSMMAAPSQEKEMESALIGV